MEDFYLKRAVQWLCCVVLAAASTHISVAEDLSFATAMPITVDADSSDFDYDTNKLVFRGLRMTQGTLGIKADLAEATNLDFDDGLWVFTGNVIIDSESTILFCDEARITFRKHQLQRAELTGQPARFEQRDPETDELTEGSAVLMVYDVLTGKVQMTEDAWFSDGANEIFGASITYDFKDRHITADSGESGPVKILIEPPAQDRP